MRIVSFVLASESYFFTQMQPAGRTVYLNPDQVVVVGGVAETTDAAIIMLADRASLVVKGTPDAVALILGQGQLG